MLAATEKVMAATNVALVSILVASSWQLSRMCWPYLLNRKSFPFL